MRFFKDNRKVEKSGPVNFPKNNKTAEQNLKDLTFSRDL